MRAASVTAPSALDVDDPLEVDLSTLPSSPALVPSISAQSNASGRWTPMNGDPMSGGPDILAQMMQQMMAPGPPGDRKSVV